MLGGHIESEACVVRATRVDVHDHPIAIGDDSKVLLEIRNQPPIRNWMLSVFSGLDAGRWRQAHRTRRYRQRELPGLATGAVV
jgi:hypothetical protein